MGRLTKMKRSLMGHIGKLYEDVQEDKEIYRNDDRNMTFPQQKTK